ncbi:MAG: O-antigen ligase family protein [Acidobacteria bacterium]|nr:O-antigen ligase family protein [Acidobacteriota bacterium]
MGHFKEPDSLQKIGYFALLFYVFFYLSRTLEISGLGALKITLLLNLVWFAMALITGGVFSFFATRAGAFFTAFALWTLISLPFSVWRGGSVETVTSVFRSLSIMGAIVALTVTGKWALRMIYGIGIGMGAASVAAIFKGTVSARGRLAMDGGTLSDSNTLCLAVLMGMPMLWLMSRNARGTVGKLLPLCFVPTILYVAYRTGSRAGMLALTVMLVLYFIRASGFKKMQMIALMVVGVAVLATSSDRLLKRFATIPGLSSEQGPADDDEAAAEGSTDGRTYLFLKSLEFTFYNPIVGVGPGQFQVAENAESVAQNRKAAWHVTHNSYTEVSSECGIPALVFFLGAVFSAFGATARVAKMSVRPGDKDAEDIRQGGIYLQMSLVTLMVGMFFLSLAYTGLIFIISGLAVALERAAKAEYMTPASRSVSNPVPLASLAPIPALSRIR